MPGNGKRMTIDDYELTPQAFAEKVVREYPEIHDIMSKRGRVLNFDRLKEAAGYYLNLARDLYGSGASTSFQVCCPSYASVQIEIKGRTIPIDDTESFAKAVAGSSDAGGSIDLDGVITFELAYYGIAGHKGGGGL